MFTVHVVGAVLLGLTGCVGERSVPPTRDTQQTSKPASGDELELVLLPRRELPDPSQWRFSPDAKHLAARDEEGCHLWLISEAHYAGVVTPGELEFDPCTDWPGTLLLGRDRLPGSLDVNVVGGEVTVSDVQGQQVWTFACDLAGGGSPDCARAYAGATANPGGDQVAMLRSDPPALEVWSRDGSAEPVTLSIPTARHPVARADLVWSARGLYVVRTGATTAGAQARVEVWLWRDLDEPAQEIFWFSGDDEGHASAAHVDPQLRWLWLVESTAVDHHPGHLRAVTSGVDIHGSGPGLRGSPLGWRGPITPSLDRPGTSEGHTGWAVGPGTAWVEVEHTQRDGYHDMRSAVTVMAPRVDRSEWVSVGEQLRAYDWQWLGVEGGQVRIDERKCEPVWPGEGRTPPPCSIAKIPQGCEVLDRPIAPSGRAGLQASWISCASGRHAGQAGLWSWVGLPMRALGTRGGGESDTLIWGDAGVAIWTRERGLTLVDAQLRDVYVDPDADAIEPATLDAELGLALIRRGATLQTVALDGRVIASIAAPAPDWAAFDPGGHRLALAWVSEIAVFELATGSALARWDAPGPLRGLAWRQDGRVLFSGHERAAPELAWDAEHGERVAAADPSPALLERLLRGQLDPSWRWSKDGNTFVRVSDGAWVVVDGTRSVVASNGRHEVDEGSSWAGVQAWALRPRNELLGDLVPLDLVTEFNEPTIDPFAAGAERAPLRVNRQRWSELVGCTEDQRGLSAPRSCPRVHDS